MIDVSALAQDKATVHPDIGSKVSREIYAKDILALPQRERQAWMHGAVTLTVQTMAMFDREKAKCIQGWYFKGNGADVIQNAFQAYKDSYATSLVIAAATNACDSED